MRLANTHGMDIGRPACLHKDAGMALNAEEFPEPNRP